MWSQRLSRRHQENDALLFGQPERGVQRLMELCHILVDERHGVSHPIESQEALRVVHINPNTVELFHIQGSFHIAVPGGKCAAITLEAPGGAVPRDAAVALVALAGNALVGEAHMYAIALNVHLKVVPAHVEALHGQNLAPFLKALGHIGVRMLPGRGVCHLSVILCEAQELVSRDGIKGHLGGICKGLLNMSVSGYATRQAGMQMSPRSEKPNAFVSDST